MNYDRTKVLTHSSVTAFHRCPAQFELIYRKNVQPRYDSPEARRGRLIHDMLAGAVRGGGEPWFDLVWNVSDRTPQDVPEIDALIQCVKDRYGEPPELVPGRAYDLPLECLQPQTEQPFWIGTNGGVCLAKCDDAAFAGTIDLLYQDDGGSTVVVRDYKTGRMIDHDGPLERNQQLRIYAYAATQLCPDARNVRLELHYIRFPYGLLSAEFPREEFAGVWNEIVALTAPIFDAIERDVFHAKPNEFCGFCDVRDHCPVWNQALVKADGSLPAKPDSFALQTHEDAAQLASMVRLVKQRASHAESALKAFVAEHGPIRVNGDVLDFHPSTKPAIDVPAVVAALLAGGIPQADVLRAMKLTKTNALALVKGRDADAKALRKSVRSTMTSVPTTKFGWVKKQDAGQ